MRGFGGIVTGGAFRPDEVAIARRTSGVWVAAFDGFTYDMTIAIVTPATARQIAAELIRLADEAEAP